MAEEAVGALDPAIYPVLNLGVLEVGDCAVVTSDGYQNYFIGEDGQVYVRVISRISSQIPHNYAVSYGKM